MIARALTLVSLVALPAALGAQWTVQPGGWFNSHSFNSGRFPDRNSGNTRNALEKQDWGTYFIYGLREGLSVGFGQGYAHLRQSSGDSVLTTTGFGATGLFVMKRIAQGRAGVLSIQPRVDLPLLYDTEDRPVLGPVRADAEIRLLYGTGYGIGGRRGFISASAGLGAWRQGADEVRYDLTVGLDAAKRVLLMGQAFNVAAFSDGDLAYSATKIGAAAMFRVNPRVGLLVGYYGGISGRNTARERTLSFAIWLSHEPATPVVPATSP